MVEEDAMKENTGRIVAQLPVDVATFLLNEKRDIVSNIEQRLNVKIVLIANSSLETPNYHVQRQRLDEIGDVQQTSYELASEVESVPDMPVMPASPKIEVEKPAVEALVPTTPKE